MAKKAKLKNISHDHEYHVVWNAVRRSWDIDRDDGQTGQFAYDKDTAIGLAVRIASKDFHAGINSVVYMIRNGEAQVVWSGPK